MNFTHQTINELIKKQNETLPYSGAVLVYKEDEEVFEQGYGYANRSERTQNTAHTRFAMASGCKIFTAVAICQLVQDGRITFDSYLKDCVGVPLPAFDPEITIHHLLTHSSGVPDYFDEEVMSDYEELWTHIPAYSMQSPRDFLPMFQDKAMTFSPGGQFSYNNSGFILLGLIVEHVTGLEFTTYVEKNIFQTCGMSDSGYFRMDQLPERTALGYIDEGATWRTNVFSVPVQGGPDGGAYTTVYDLEKFWKALLNHKLLTPAYTDLLFTPHIRASEYIYYGYGVWIVKKAGAIFKYYVMGSDPGVIMHSSVYPELNIHAHMMGNINKGAGLIAQKLDELIYPNL
ncbi:serine hydrolase domain-containing protein [Paenibacillus lutrae]|uniref:Serine hydrolase n=1 Tax=Paenibacillus lutrae TaxID=2078573 RepID=A0A7X3FGW1_9BACL|nr:serine hydrolase [Paenibacillus lutrae]MVO99535.1 serine hydrolase [Paenibacillus lutrae]